MGGINEYSQTAADNATVGGVSVAEGMNPGLVNNGMRAQMADVAKWRDDIGGALTSGGSANVQTLTTNGVITALADGQMVSFVAGAGNSGATTLNVDGTGAKKVLVEDGDELIGGELLVGGHYIVQYDASADSSSGAWMLMTPTHTNTFQANQIITGANPRLLFDGTDGSQQWQIGIATTDFIIRDATAGDVLAYLNTSGNLIVDGGVFSNEGGSTAPGFGNTVVGAAIAANGVVLGSADASVSGNFNRNGDGAVVQIRESGATEGTISVSGNIVTYGNFCGTHWSQLVDKAKPDIKRGTIVETINERCQWLGVEFTDANGNQQRAELANVTGRQVGDVITYEYKLPIKKQLTIPESTVFLKDKKTGEIREVILPERIEEYTAEGTFTAEAKVVSMRNDQLVRFKVSDTPKSKSVYGVFVFWDDDDDNNDAYVAAIGACLIRIASGHTVQKDDLIESNGDGCGRVQPDDLFRSSTVAKVTCTDVIETFDDGSYLVPCTLHCG